MSERATLHEYVYLPNLSAMSRMWYKVSFKQSTTDLNSIFLLDLLSYQPSLPNNLTIAEFVPFPESIGTIWNPALPQYYTSSLASTGLFLEVQDVLVEFHVVILLD